MANVPVILPRMPPRKPEAEVPRRCEGTVVGRESELCGGLPLTIVRTVTWREPNAEREGEGEKIKINETMATDAIRKKKQRIVRIEC